MESNEENDDGISFPLLCVGVFLAAAVLPVALIAGAGYVVYKFSGDEEDEPAE